MPDIEPGNRAILTDHQVERLSRAIGSSTASRIALVLQVIATLLVSGISVMAYFQIDRARLALEREEITQNRLDIDLTVTRIATVEGEGTLTAICKVEIELTNRGRFEVWFDSYQIAIFQSHAPIDATKFSSDSVPSASQFADRSNIRIRDSWSLLGRIVHKCTPEQSRLEEIEGGELLLTEAPDQWLVSPSDTSKWEATISVPLINKSMIYVEGACELTLPTGGKRWVTSTKGLMFKDVN